jgi:hypothetical protein
MRWFRRTAGDVLIGSASRTLKGSEEIKQLCSDLFGLFFQLRAIVDPYRVRTEDFEVEISVREPAFCSCGAAFIGTSTSRF